MPPIKLDAIDIKILGVLQDDASISNTELADRVGLSQSPCLRRVKALEDAKIIRKRVTLLDPRSIDLCVNVFVSVTLEKQVRERLQDFETEVLRRPEVLECYLMTGEADYLLRVVVQDLDAYERFLKNHLTRITGVASIKSSFALNQVQYRTALPLGHIEV
ncbi:MAG TPA: Lrp/AsnC family transcriptional regulator [Hyphomicrobiaceae bacterium]|nr:Lrp/AsnC family transcriptional regulator [Hyphomicrobiaceae bacterium]